MIRAHPLEHILFKPHPKVGLLICNTVLVFREGEAVEVNNLGRHAVQNNGDTDCIHLIFEFYVLDQPDPERV